MKITELDLQAEGKKYFCKDINEVFEVEEGNLIAATRRFSMADLLKFDFEEVKETKNPYTRVDIDERYYFVNEGGRVKYFKDLNDNYDDDKFNTLNYFNNKNYAEYIAFKETLMRKLDKFAWEHNAKVIDWHDRSTKYYISFEYEENELTIDAICTYRSNNIYFTSKEIAEMALEKFKDDLMKLYTWEFDF